MNDMVLTIPEIILRLGIAMLFGGAIGFERQYKNRPAGMRTHTYFSLYGSMYHCIDPSRDR